MLYASKSYARVVLGRTESLSKQHTTNVFFSFVYIQWSFTFFLGGGSGEQQGTKANIGKI